MDTDLNKESQTKSKEDRVIELLEQQNEALQKILGCLHSVDGRLKSIYNKASPYGRI